MEIIEILEQFDRLKEKFPREAVEAAIEQREAIAPELLRVLEETIDRAEEYAEDDDYMAHFYAMYLLAQFRDTRACPLVARLAQLDGDVLEALCGDFVTETLGRVLASVCDGDLTGIQAILQNEAAQEWSRGAALDALVTLVVAGVKSREEIVDYFARMFRGGLERKYSVVWDGLVASASDLWPGELMAEIEQAYAEGLVDEFAITMDDVRQDLALGKDAALALRARNRHFWFVDNTVKDFGSWACFQPKKAHADFRTTTGRTEPALKLPAPLATGFAPVWNPAPKAGRNDPCRWGSGKKYKECCLQERTGP